MTQAERWGYRARRPDAGQQCRGLPRCETRFTECSVDPAAWQHGFTPGKATLRKLGGRAATTGLALGWSASPYANNNTNAWNVNFNNGNENTNNKNNNNYVRLVRGGE